MIEDLLAIDSSVSGPVIQSLTAALYNPVTWIAVGGFVLFGVFIGRIR